MGEPEEDTPELNAHPASVAPVVTREGLSGHSDDGKHGTQANETQHSASWSLQLPEVRKVIRVSFAFWESAG
jgi:hypothetical protein